jgi:L-lysine 2,3-aminomutase
MIPARPRDSQQISLHAQPSVEHAGVEPVGVSTTWQAELAAAITSPRELLALLGLEAHWHPEMERAAQSFRMRVPRPFAGRMQYGNPADPLLRQVLPLGAELASPADFVSDPLAESAAQSVPGLLHKYVGRALLITTGACAVHCRYCFRREFPYAEQTTNNPRMAAALAAIANDSSIEEVILSGGDPLSLATARLAELTAEIERIPHVQRIRVHTRQPIVLPARVDPALLRWAEGLRLPLVIVLHANHAQEIDSAVASSLAALKARGATLLNQAVLLAGVNDTAHAQIEMWKRLFAVGVLPYYLHLLDKVRGASHFDVPFAKARQLLAEVSVQLPGFLVPKLAREVPGAASKLTFSPHD